MEWLAAADFAGVLPKLDVGRIKHPEQLGEAEFVKDNTVRTVMRVEHPGAPGGPRLYVKRFKFKNAGRKLRHLLTPTQAAREWRIGLAFRREGIPTCRVLATAARRRGAFHQEAFLVTEEITEAISLTEYLASPQWRPRGIRLKRELIEELASLMVRMLEAGYYHRDLHAGNLLIAPRRTAGRRLFVLDLHSVRRGRPTRRRVLRMLAMLADSTKRSGITGADRIRLLRALLAKALLQNPLRRPEAERERRGQGGRSRRFKGQNRRCRPTQSLGARSRSKPGWGFAAAPKWMGTGEVPAAVLSKWARWAQAAWQRHDRRHMRSRTRRCVLESTLFTRDRACGYRVMRRRDFPLEQAMASLQTHRGAIAGEDGLWKVRKNGPRTEVTTGEVCVKAFLRRAWRERIKDMLRPKGRARAAWLAHRGARVRGLPAARGLALLEATSKLAGRPDYLITEALDVEGDLQQMSYTRLPGSSDLSGPALTDQERRRLTVAVARLLRLLAEKAVEHPDTKPSNILAGKEDGELRLWLVDLDRMRFEAPWGREQWVLHLAQCDAGLPLQVSLRERMRCLRECGRWRWTPRERLQIARSVRATSLTRRPRWAH